MEDSELEGLRAKRMAELQASQQGGNTEKDRAEKAKEAELAKNSILSQILDQGARARLSTLMIAKPEKGQMVENMLLNMARMGQLGGKLNEEQLIGLLERVSERTTTKTTVKFDRRRAALDDDDM